MTALAWNALVLICECAWNPSILTQCPILKTCATSSASRRVRTNLHLGVVHAGLGRPLDEVPLPREEALTLSLLYLYFAELMYAFSLAFSKMSILGMYWRLFSQSDIRLPIQVLFGCSVVWLIIRTFMAIFHCVPVYAFWDHSIEGARCDINDSEFFFGTVLVHLLIDIVILMLPVMQVRKLHLRLGQKVGVIGLFMFGVL